MTPRPIIHVAPASTGDGLARYRDRVESLLGTLQSEVVAVRTRKPGRLRRLFSLIQGFPSNSESLSRSAKRQLPASPSVYVCDHVSSARVVLRHARVSDEVVYTSQNVESALRVQVARQTQGLSAVVRRLDAWATERAETKICERSAFVTAISRDDADHLRRAHGCVAFLLLPYNEFDVTGQGGRSGLAATRTWDARLAALAVFGSSEWSVKRWQFLELLEALRSVGDAGIPIHVVGRHSEAFLNEIRSRLPFVETVGPVSDPVEALAGYRWGLLYEPLGGGFQMRVLDYIKAGTPIFTVEGAYRGLLASEAVLVAPTLAGLDRLVLSRFDDEETWLKAVQAGYSCLEKPSEIRLLEEELTAAIAALVSRRVGR